MTGAAIERVDVVTPDGVRLDAALHRPEDAPIARVLLVHGITADLDEGGLFGRLADALVRRGFVVLRFSFRGHGSSGGRQEGVTIGGEMLDLATAYRHLDRFGGGDGAAIVAASFGAVSTSLLLGTLPRPPRALVYWNPVLDLRQTFLEPSLPWGIAHFGDRVKPSLEANGYVEVAQPWREAGFRLGPALFAEMHNYDVRAAFVASQVPALVVHGDNDSAVSYDVAEDASRERPHTTFERVAGSEHGFHLDGHDDHAIRVTCDWLTHQFGADAS